MNQSKYNILSRNAFNYASKYNNNKKFISQNERLFE